jgi:hypothetical protein
MDHFIEKSQSVLMASVRCIKKLPQEFAFAKMLWKFTILPIVANAHWLFRNWVLPYQNYLVQIMCPGFSSNGFCHHRCG